MRSTFANVRSGAVVVALALTVVLGAQAPTSATTPARAASPGWEAQSRAVTPSVLAPRSVPGETTRVPVGRYASFSAPWCGTYADSPPTRTVLLQQLTKGRWVTVARGRETAPANPHCSEGGFLIRWKPTKVGTVTMRFHYLPDEYDGEATPFRLTVVGPPPVPTGGSTAGWGATGATQRGGGLWPSQLPGLRGARTVVAAGSSWFAVMADGTVRAWGDNAAGQLGDGTTTARSVPVVVKGLAGVRSVTAAFGGATVFAVLADGTLRGWGDNGAGQIGDGTTTSRRTPVPVPVRGPVSAVASACGATYAVLRDGTVDWWGTRIEDQYADSGPRAATPEPVPGLSGVADVVVVPATSNCSASGLALHTDGTVSAWGVNAAGELGDGTTTPHWTPATVPGLVGVRRITASVEQPPRYDPLAGADGGNPTVYAELTDGRALAWGANGSGQVGNGTTTTQPTPAPIPLPAPVRAITAHEGSAWAVLTDGTVRAWGANGGNQLGDGGAATPRVAPVEIPRLTSIIELAAGGYQFRPTIEDYPTVAWSHLVTCARAETGTVSCWGDNDWGQLGDGTLVSQRRPRAVLGLPAAKSLVIGATGVVVALR